MEMLSSICVSCGADSIKDKNNCKYTLWAMLIMRDPINFSAFLGRVCDRHFEWESDNFDNGGDGDSMTDSEWEYEWIEDNGDKEPLNIHGAYCTEMD